MISLSTFETIKRPEMRFRALLTGGVPEAEVALVVP
jgi:hypothetical protein